MTLWVGAPMPEKVKTLTDRMAAMNSANGWTYRVWGEEIWDAYGNDPFVRRLQGMKASFAHIVDRLRLLLLRDYGGFWLDSDCEPIRPLSVLNRICDRPEVDFCTGVRDPWRKHVHPTRGVALVDNTVMGSAKNGKMVNRLLSMYRAEDPKQTGLLAGAEVLRRCDDSVVLLGYAFFYADPDSQTPETVVLHDETSLGSNLGSWTEQHHAERLTANALRRP